MVWGWGTGSIFRTRLRFSLLLTALTIRTQRESRVRGGRAGIETVEALLAL